MPDSRRGVLGVKGLTFSPPNILLLIVTKQLNVRFMWPQSFPPEGFYFVPVISSKLQFSFKVPCLDQEDAPDVKHIWLWTLALFTQRLRIISGEVVRQFSTDGDSHRAKYLHLHVCNSHRKPALRLLKRRDGIRHVDDVGVSQVFPLLI